VGTPQIETAELVSGRRGQKVQSAETGMTVLKALGQLGGGATISALAAHVGEHPAKVHRYLSSLISAGFVEQDLARGRYMLGSEAILLGLAAQRQSGALRLAADATAELVEKLSVSCFVAVMSDHGPVIVHWDEPAQAIVINARVGSIVPVLWSATGLAFAAFQKSDLIDTLINRELASATEEQRRQFPDRRAVDAMLEGYRAQRCTWVRTWLLQGVSAVAAPIFDAAGHVPAVVVGIGVSDSFDVHPEGTNAKMLRGSAARISQRLGYVVPESA
jgi:DNA-binding IclR family transcriptional regulator